MKLSLGNKKITIRKWKGKDKKSFMNSMKQEKMEEKEIMNALVYSCIEEDVVLSVDEFRYVLSRIRALSLGEDIEFEFYCDECGTVHKQTFKLNDIIRFSYTNLKEIKVKNVHIKLTDIRNKDSYIKLIKEDEIYDLLLRVDSINGNNAFTMESLIEFFDDLDIDVLTEIIDIFESSKFTIDDINTVKCPKCGDEVQYKFDELPGFLPESWFENI